MGSWKLSLLKKNVREALILYRPREAQSGYCARCVSHFACERVHGLIDGKRQSSLYCVSSQAPLKSGRKRKMESEDKSAFTSHHGLYQFFSGLLGLENDVSAFHYVMDVNCSSMKGQLCFSVLGIDRNITEEAKSTYGRYMTHNVFTT